MDGYVVSQAHGAIVRVLLPGVGFCCVRRKDDVLSETAASLPVARTHPVRSLALRVGPMFDAIAITRLLQRIGAPLTELILMNVGARGRDTVSLDTMLSACPRLARLELSRLNMRLASLANDSWGRSLASLSLRSCAVAPSWWPFKRRLTDTVFSRLTSLVVDATDVAHPPALQTFLVELAVARDLQRFVVACDGDAAVQEACRRHMERYNGECVRSLSLRHTLAVLSVLSPIHASSSVNVNVTLPADAIARILALVAPRIRRRIWTLVE